MSATIHDPSPRFRVSVTRTTQTTARAEAHGQALDFAIKGGDPTLGFTPPEVLLAALGGCILSTLTREAAEMGLVIAAVEVTFDAAKRVEPLGIDPLRYRVALTSDEPAARLEELYQLATTEGAVTNALLGGVTPETELVVNSPAALGFI